MAEIRTFIGVAASQRVTSNVARVVSRLAATNAGYRWVDPENLHVAMNIVGAVRDIEVPEIIKLVKNTVQDFPRFEMSLQGVSGFPTPEQPRVLWTGVDEGADVFREMHAALADELHLWGINRDRNTYVPHMTLGRVERGGRWNDEMMEQMHRLRNHDGGFCGVNEVVVYSNYMDRSGPTYTPMSRIKLA
jgi:2'-5' RNA ligase